ncbi:hypothetical protein [Sphingomonas adhaesiva]|uniref:hypothetical protein n=1 Tax=Sphingomonas adhaesiva TaxID=28212 RepID=UPI002FFA605C
MQDNEARKAAPLAIGTVLGGAFGVMRGNPATVFAIAFLLGALPQQLFGYLLTVETGDNPNAQLGKGALFFGFLVVFLLGSMLSQAALVRTTSAYLEGRSIGLGESLRGGLAKVLPLLGLSILLGLGVMLGMALLFVPGVILFVMWSVAAPALVEEDAGVTEAFGRSRALTKGARWRIFFVMVVALVITWLLAAVAAIPGAILSEGSGIAGTLVVGAFTATITTALWSTLLTSLYFTLRERGEGPQTDRLAEVFA